MFVVVSFLSLLLQVTTTSSAALGEVSPACRSAFIIPSSSTARTCTRTHNQRSFASSCTHLKASLSSSLDESMPQPQQGLYRPFVEHAWKKLQESGLFIPMKNVPLELASNSVPAKGNDAGSVVQMEIKAMVPNDTNSSAVVRYARYALLETIVPKTHQQQDNKNCTTGIQVMNLVVFPSWHVDLPVWGVDLVSLPGGKHLLAMDVQPMSTTNHDATTTKRFQHWHATYVQDVFEWGGSVPPNAAKFFSPTALWTRLSDKNATQIIQTRVWDAFCQHLDLYIDMLQTYNATSTTSENVQDEYVQYRLENDPARPMLQRLYGPEWTEQVLETLLFPSI